MNSKSQKITDKQFDAELNRIVGTAVEAGVNPVVIIGLLQINIMEVDSWRKKNEETIRQLHQELKAGQLTIVDPDSIPPEQIKKETIAAVDAIMRVGVDKDGNLLKPEPKGIEGVLANGVAPAVKIVEKD